MSNSKSSSKSSSSSEGGIGFFGLLTVVFITLKLMEVITWSWWMVLSPIWIPATIAILILVGIFVYQVNKGSKN